MSIANEIPRFSIPNFGFGVSLSEFRNISVLEILDAQVWNAAPLEFSILEVMSLAAVSAFQFLQFAAFRLQEISDSQFRNAAPQAGRVREIFLT